MKAKGKQLKMSLGLALLALFGLLWGGRTAVAQVTPITFDGFTGAGFTPGVGTPGSLDSNLWRVTGLSDENGTFGGTHTTGDFARGTSNGGVNTGGVYAFTNVGNTGNTILGIQPTETDFTPGTFTLRIQNNTGNNIADIYIAYEIWYRNDQPRANSLNFSYSTDDINYTSVPAFDFTTPETADPTPTWQSVSRGQTFIGVNLGSGDYIYLSWTGNDVSGSNNRDEYGIDNIEVRIGDPTAVTLQSLSAQTSTAWLPILAVVMLLLGLVGVVKRPRRMNQDK